MDALLFFILPFKKKNLCTITCVVYFTKYILNKFVYSIKYM